MRAKLLGSTLALGLTLGFYGCGGVAGDFEDDPTLGVYEEPLTSSTGGKTCTSPKKVLICHIPPGNPANAHSICVGVAAKPAHLAHGDLLGGCEGQSTDGGAGGGTGGDDPFDDGSGGGGADGGSGAGGGDGSAGGGDAGSEIN